MPGRGIRKTESFLAQAATARERVPSVLEAIAGAEFVLARFPDIGTAVPGRPLRSLPIHPEEGVTYKVIHSFNDREVVFQALYPAVAPGFGNS